MHHHHDSTECHQQVCCGSAGTYSILQPELSRKLLSNKLKSLQARQPELITTVLDASLAFMFNPAG